MRRDTPQEINLMIEQQKHQLELTKYIDSTARMNSERARIKALIADLESRLAEAVG